MNIIIAFCRYLEFIYLNQDIILEPNCKTIVKTGADYISVIKYFIHYISTLVQNYKFELVND